MSKFLSQSVFPIVLPTIPDNKLYLTEVLGKDYYVKKILSGLSWGIVYVSKCNLLIFSDIINKKLIYFDIKKNKIVNNVENVPHINGNLYNGNNELYNCDGDGFISKLNIKTKELSVVIDKYEENYFNSPNDLIKINNKLIFTDPPIGRVLPGFGILGPFPQSQNRVYVYDLDTKAIYSLIDDLNTPNGLALSNDNKTLYVSDSNLIGPPSPSYLYSYDFDEINCTVSNKKIFSDNISGIADGVKVDKTGNIWLCCGTGIQCYSPDKRYLGILTFPENITNFVITKYGFYATGRSNVYYIKPSNYLIY